MVETLGDGHSSLRDWVCFPIRDPALKRRAILTTSLRDGKRRRAACNSAHGPTHPGRVVGTNPGLTVSLRDEKRRAAAGHGDVRQDTTPGWSKTTRRFNTAPVPSSLRDESRPVNTAALPSRCSNANAVPSRRLNAAAARSSRRDNPTIARRFNAGRGQHNIESRRNDLPLKSSVGMAARLAGRRAAAKAGVAPGCDSNWPSDGKGARASARFNVHPPRTPGRGEAVGPPDVEAA